MVDLIAGEISVRRGLHRLGDGSYVFSQPKSAKSKRTIALPPSATLVLKEHQLNQRFKRNMVGRPLPDSDFVFSAYDNKPLRPNTITRAWENLASKAGVKVIRFHDARHTHASLMLKQGVHPKIGQERLGHASIQITLDTYSHVAPGLQEAAAKHFDDILPASYNRHAEGKLCDHSVTISTEITRKPEPLNVN
ncbi:MAG: site-specific integrase [Chloroflexota bacterium]